MKSRLLLDALRIAKEKLPRHPQFEHWPHYTFIVQSNKILDWGYNLQDIPPIHMGYHERINWGLPKTHSELSAWRAAKGLLNPSKSFEAINIRLSRQGEMRDSKPCSCCYQFLCSLGCSSCYFSTDLGFAKLLITG